MSKISGGRMAARVMKRHGISHLFGVVGGHVYPIFEACEAEGIRVIDVRHEESGAHMAEGWALTTGRPRRVHRYRGPRLHQHAHGRGERLRRLVTGARHRRSRHAPRSSTRGALQDFNQIDIVKPMTKYARSMLRDEAHSRVLRHRDPPRDSRPAPCPGLPRDADVTGCLRQIDDVGPGHAVRRPVRRSLPAGNPDDIEKRHRADRPRRDGRWWWRAAGVWWAQAQERPCKAFVERAELPLFTRAAGRGCVPGRAPALHCAAGIPAQPRHEGKALEPRPT